MVDWKKVETEYLTENVSYRDLAQRHGVSLSVVKGRGSREGWVEKRRVHTQAAQDTVLSADTARRVDRLEKLMAVADKLLGRVEQLTQEDTVNPAALKTLSEALKNIRDAQMIKSAADLQEQAVRIEKLRREVGKAEAGNCITVTLEGETGEFAR